jgi:hypothetical protein
MLPIVSKKTMYRGELTTLILIVDADYTLRKAEFVAKNSRELGANIYIQKQNALAGGSVSEIDEVLIDSVTPNKTKFQVILGPSDTENLSLQKLYFDFDSIDPDDISDRQTLFTGVLYINPDVNSPYQSNQNQNYPTWGTTAQRPDLTASDVGFEYYDTDLQTPVWWNGSAWDDTL